MRDTSKRAWQSWRVTLAETPATPAPSPRFARSQMTSHPDSQHETPGPDGIRHGLVARIKAEIEAGTYDTEERWQQAEERLFARLEAAR